ncbi:D-aspartate ligase [Luteibacter sp. 621]|jgi:predicted ATP-grasp superfamily ATP-dependent carboligase|uniref:carboxylate--amine ligase n=1 Tax=Luteibacter sp. 621 TaxID=3373916 RepID=UPI003D1B0D5E
MGDVAAGRVPAIVMGRGPTAVGILRSLALAGIPAYVACPPGDMATRSRWYRPTPGAAWDGTPGPQALDALREMPLERAVIIPGADDAAMWLTHLPASDVGTRFLVCSSTRTVQSLLQDKAVFAGYVAAAHIPHPRTFRLTTLADVAEVPMHQLDRVFIKPVNSQRFSDVVGAKGVWVDSRDGLRDAWARFHAQGFSVMAQEYVPGPPTDHYFIDGFRDANGAYPGLFARRRLRMSPPDFGNSSCSRAIPLDAVPEAERHVRRLLDGLDYRGIFSAELKRDPRDGEFRIIEVNTRAWTYVEFAARRGVNVCDMAWRDAQELPVPRAPRQYPAGRYCVDLYHDIASLRRQGASVLDIVGQWMHADLHVFRMDDAKPALHAIGRMVRKRFERTGAHAGEGQVPRPVR